MDRFAPVMSSFCTARATRGSMQGCTKPQETRKNSGISGLPVCVPGSPEGPRKSGISGSLCLGSPEIPDLVIKTQNFGFYTKNRTQLLRVIMCNFLTSRMVRLSVISVIAAFLFCKNPEINVSANTRRVKRES